MTDQSVEVKKKVLTRELTSYPTGARRTMYLLLVILGSVVLWYQYYVPTSVATVVLPQFHMTFKYYVYIIVIANVAGVLAALLGGLADKFGRANIVIVGLAVVSAIQTFMIPNATSKTMFAVGIILVGFFEGVVLVATPALVRDFTPQLGRASAMGFWTLGPVAGVLTASLVATHTLAATSTDWQREFLISGISGIVIFVICGLFLRELSPAIRDQLMVSYKDRELVELRAKGIDIKEATKNPWGQMIKPEILLSAFAISVMLIIFYTASGFFPVYFTTVFQKNGLNAFSLQQANGIDTWIWAADCISLVVFGLLSDLLKVRKPFMFLGAIGALGSLGGLIILTSEPGTGYYTLVAMTVALFAFLGMAYSSWMAGFTETVEARNPALVATGLAIWGGLLRFIVAASLFVLPFVVSSTNSVVDNQQYAQYAPKALQIEKQYGPLIKIVENNQKLFNQLSATSPTNKDYLTLVGQAAKASGGLNNLIKISKIKPQLEYLQTYAPYLIPLQNGLQESGHQWEDWFWICFGGIVLFIPFIFIMKGRWNPESANRDAAEHERFIIAELANFRAANLS